MIRCQGWAELFLVPVGCWLVVPWHWSESVRNRTLDLGESSCRRSPYARGTRCCLSQTGPPPNMYIHVCTVIYSGDCLHWSAHCIYSTLRSTFHSIRRPLPIVYCRLPIATPPCPQKSPLPPPTATATSLLVTASHSLPHISTPPRAQNYACHVHASRRPFY